VKGEQHISPSNSMGEIILSNTFTEVKELSEYYKSLPLEHSDTE